MFDVTLSNIMGKQELKEYGFIFNTAINSLCNRNIPLYTSLFIYETSVKHLKTLDERCSVNAKHYLETICKSPWKLNFQLNSA